MIEIISKLTLNTSNTSTINKTQIPHYIKIFLSNDDVERIKKCKNFIDSEYQMEHVRFLLTTWQYITQLPLPTIFHSDYEGITVYHDGIIFSCPSIDGIDVLESDNLIDLSSHLYKEFGPIKNEDDED